MGTYSLVFVILCLLHVSCCICYTNFAFGDSIVDAGNNNYLPSLSKADYSPYGIDFTPSGGKPTGRYTNGFTIVDIVAQALGAKTLPTPSLAANAVSHATLGGINYASGASGILDGTGSLFVGRLPLRTQIDHFEASRAEMVKTMGENGTQDLLKNAIFSLTIGSNDIITYFLPNLPFVGIYDVSPTTLQDIMVSNMTFHLKEFETGIVTKIETKQINGQTIENTSVTQEYLSKINVRQKSQSQKEYLPWFTKRLHKLGARKIVVVDIGPLGCIPFVRSIHFLPAGKCHEEMNTLIRGYNQKLHKAVHGLNQEMGSGSVFVYANSYDVINRMLQNYHDYGFENVNDPCCGDFFPISFCIRIGDENEISTNICDDRSKYLFWDSYHPGEAANFIIAQHMLNGDENICSPLNVRQLHYHKL